MNLTSLLTPNTLIIVGVAVALGALFLDTSKLSGLFTKLKSLLLPENKSEPKTYNLHDLVQVIVEQCIASEDDEGLHLITTFGKHLYDAELEKLEVPHNEG